MIIVALKMLVGDRLKYIGLIAGIAFAALLITQQGSILVGLAHQTGSFIRDTGQADLWVMDDQVRFSQDSLTLTDTTLSRVRSIEGVEWAVPMYQGFLRARLADGTRMQIILVGLDDATLMGAPPEMSEGSLADLRRDKAVFIDESFKDSKMAMRRGQAGQAMQMGDRFDINDREVEVVGTFRASKSFFWEPVVYTTYSRALQLAPAERRMLAYVLVKVRPGYDIPAVQTQINEAMSVSGLKAVTGPEFEKITSDYILFETGILVNFGLAVGLGFIIGVLVSGQMLYNFTLDNLRHFGALKAMGASNGRLVVMVLSQVLVVGLLGYGIGIGAGAVLGSAVGSAGLAFLMPWWIPVGVAVAILVICILAGLLSISRILQLEPAVVFKA